MLSDQWVKLSSLTQPRYVPEELDDTAPRVAVKNQESSEDGAPSRAESNRVVPLFSLLSETLSEEFFFPRRKALSTECPHAGDAATLSSAPAEGDDAHANVALSHKVLLAMHKLGVPSTWSQQRLNHAALLVRDVLQRQVTLFGDGGTSTVDVVQPAVAGGAAVKKKSLKSVVRGTASIVPRSSHSMSMTSLPSSASSTGSRALTTKTAAPPRPKQRYCKVGVLKIDNAVLSEFDIPVDEAAAAEALLMATSRPESGASESRFTPHSVPPRSAASGGSDRTDIKEDVAGDVRLLMLEDLTTECREILSVLEKLQTTRQFYVPPTARVTFNRVLQPAGLQHQPVPKILVSEEDCASAATAAAAVDDKSRNGEGDSAVVFSVSYERDAILPLALSDSSSLQSSQSEKIDATTTTPKQGPSASPASVQLSGSAVFLANGSFDGGGEMLNVAPSAASVAVDEDLYSAVRNVAPSGDPRMIALVDKYEWEKDKLKDDFDAVDARVCIHSDAILAYSEDGSRASTPRELQHQRAYGAIRRVGTFVNLAPRLSVAEVAARITTPTPTAAASGPEPATLQKTSRQDSAASIMSPLSRPPLAKKVTEEPLKQHLSALVNSSFSKSPIPRKKPAVPPVVFGEFFVSSMAVHPSQVAAEKAAFQLALTQSLNSSQGNQQPPEPVSINTVGRQSPASLPARRVPIVFLQSRDYLLHIPKIAFKKEQKSDEDTTSNDNASESSSDDDEDIIDEATENLFYDLLFGIEAFQDTETLDLEEHQETQMLMSNAEVATPFAQKSKLGGQLLADGLITPPPTPTNWVPPVQTHYEMAPFTLMMIEKANRGDDGVPDRPAFQMEEDEEDPSPDPTFASSDDASIMASRLEAERRMQGEEDKKRTQAIRRLQSISWSSQEEMMAKFFAKSKSNALVAGHPWVTRTQLQMRMEGVTSVVNRWMRGGGRNKGGGDASVAMKAEADKLAAQKQAEIESHVPSRRIIRLMLRMLNFGTLLSALMTKQANIAPLDDDNYSNVPRASEAGDAEGGTVGRTALSEQIAKLYEREMALLRESQRMRKHGPLVDWDETLKRIDIHSIPQRKPQGTPNFKKKVEAKKKKKKKEAEVEPVDESTLLKDGPFFQHFLPSVGGLVKRAAATSHIARSSAAGSTDEPPPPGSSLSQTSTRFSLLRRYPREQSMTGGVSASTGGRSSSAMHEAPPGQQDTTQQEQLRRSRKGYESSMLVFSAAQLKTKQPSPSRHVQPRGATPDVVASLPTLVSQHLQEIQNVQKESLQYLQQLRFEQLHNTTPQ